MEPIDTEEHRDLPATNKADRKMVVIVIATAIAFVVLIVLNMK